MKPWNAWLYSLGLAGVCLVGAAGCGGGGVPDASEEGQASADEGPSEPAPPPADPAPGPAAAPNPAIAAQARGQAPAAAPSAEAAPEAEAAEAPAAARPEANSATAEMLAIATGGGTPNAEAEGGQASGPGGPGGPGAMMGPMGPRGPGGMMAPGRPGADGPGQSQAEMMARMGVGGPPGANPGPGSAAEMQQMAASMMARNRGAMGQPGGARPGGPGMMSGGPGGGYPGSGGGAEAGDTTSPHGAVKAFLSALKAKDRERLTEATALRASTPEEGGKYRDMFARIIDSSIADSELDDLASKLEGYSVSGENQVKSTGRLGVTIKKSADNGGWLSRTVTVRKEKKGWGVLDISQALEFHGNGRRTTGTPGRR